MRALLLPARASIPLAFFPFPFASLMQFALITSDVASEKFYMQQKNSGTQSCRWCAMCIPRSFITTQWVHAIRERFKVLCGFSSRFQPLEVRFVGARLLASHFDEVSTLHLVHYYNHWQLAFYHTLVCAFPLRCQCQSDKAEKIYSLSLLCSPIVRWHFSPQHCNSWVFFVCCLAVCWFACLFGCRHLPNTG